MICAGVIVQVLCVYSASVNVWGASVYMWHVFVRTLRVKTVLPYMCGVFLYWFSVC